jgi:DNA-binding CsgD family transcriptional regulator
VTTLGNTGSSLSFTVISSNCDSRPSRGRMRSSDNPGVRGLAVFEARGVEAARYGRAVGDGCDRACKTEGSDASLDWDASDSDDAGAEEAQERHARQLVKSLAVSDAWLQHGSRFQAPDLPGLTDRQREILGYVGLGYTNPEIARACGISKFTVRNQLVRLFERFGVATRTELAQLTSSSQR